MALFKTGLNDMLGKGWDSAAQESFCWQRFMENPNTSREANQFWWVPRVWKIHGHAPNWEAHTRRDNGQFLNFPPPIGEGGEGGEGPTEASTVVKLLRLATMFPVDEKRKAEQLINLATQLSGGELQVD